MAEMADGSGPQSTQGLGARSKQAEQSDSRSSGKGLQDVGDMLPDLSFYLDALATVSQVLVYGHPFPQNLSTPQAWAHNLYVLCPSESVLPSSATRVNACRPFGLKSESFFLSKQDLANLGQKLHVSDGVAICRKLPSRADSKDCKDFETFRHWGNLPATERKRTHSAFLYYIDETLPLMSTFVSYQGFCMMIKIPVSVLHPSVLQNTCCSTITLNNVFSRFVSLRCPLNSLLLSRKLRMLLSNPSSPSLIYAHDLRAREAAGSPICR